MTLKSYICSPVKRKRLYSGIKLVRQKDKNYTYSKLPLLIFRKKHTGDLTHPVISAQTVSLQITDFKHKMRWMICR